MRHLDAMHSPRSRVAYVAWSAGFAVLLIVSLGVGVVISSVDISIPDVYRAVAGQLGIGPGVDANTAYIVIELRLPRVIEAAVVGAGLAVCGTVLQSLTGNVLADPYILGMASGAAVGATVVITTGLTVSVMAGLAGMGTVSAAAFVGSIAALLLVFAIASTRAGALLPERLVLAGIAVAQGGSAVASVFILFADPGASQEVIRWMLGSVAGARWSNMPMLLIVVGAVVIGVFTFSRSLDAFAFGERSAMSLGVNVTVLRWCFYLAVSVCTAAIVAVAGIIGFVGLVVPHAARMIVGPLHGRVLPMTALGGALLLTWADIIARSVLPQQELPVGLVTAIIGVPAFVVLLRRRRGVQT